MTRPAALSARSLPKKKAPGGIAVQGLLSVGTEPEQIAQVPKYSPGIHHRPVLGNFQLTVMRQVLDFIE
jgi:hypothetical protein